MISFWEAESLLQYHYIIAGAGITGLSTAIELKERFPEKSVLVLERGLLPTGASTRNAGFACMGSVTELLDDLNTLTLDRMVELFEWRKAGLLKLRKRLGDTAISYRENGSYELIHDNQEFVLEKMNWLNKILGKSNRHVFKPANDKIDLFGFSRKYVGALIENTGEGELHPGHMMHSLIKMALNSGVEIKTGASVKSFEDVPGKVLIRVSDPFTGEDLQFAGAKFIICTNAFTQSLLHHEDIRPGRGQVMITKPVKRLKFKGIFHLDKGFTYFRETNGRVLIGGGRNLDMEKESTFEFYPNEKILNNLEEKLREIILPGTDFEIDQRWTGIMAFGPDKFPVIKQVSENVYGAFRLGGMGIALGSKVAENLAILISKNA